jgi:hypothetical protein
MLEYRVVKTRNHKRMESMLNELAKDGWEMVSYRLLLSWIGVGDHLAVLQRES